ncbi:DUF2946 family protein [Caldimonas taiwanensis]|uniref:DUF2946 family protein n=1 Tax=Caldimonas taiwanensis TaxID=307483 RepID=UPI0007812B29|nr:DUF2946 family protein [Caldimonas taiwanensis]
MSPPRPLSLCWLALMLVLKAALPWLAVGAAQAQGKTLVEVCTVYGVKTVVLDDRGQVLDDSADPEDSHADAVAASGEHCVLASLVAHAAPGLVWTLPSRFYTEGLPPPATAPPRPVLDAAAQWAVWLHHAPPVLS